MPLQGLTASIVNDRRHRRHELDHPVTDERSVFDRTMPSRSHTIRSDGQRRQVMPRSQSVGRIDSLLESVNDSAMLSDSPETGNRLRRRLDVIRSNLVARVVRKRSRGAKDDISGHQKGEVAPETGEPEVPDAVRQSTTVWNDADTSSVSSPSSPTTTVFDRRRVHRRTPRRHRTVIDGQQVETARGLLRRHASEAPEALGPVVSDVILRQSSPGTGSANSITKSVSSNINIYSDNDTQQLR